MSSGVSQRFCVRRAQASGCSAGAQIGQGERRGGVFRSGASRVYVCRRDESVTHGGIESGAGKFRRRARDRGRTRSAHGRACECAAHGLRRGCVRLSGIRGGVGRREARSRRRDGRHARRSKRARRLSTRESRRHRGVR